MPYCPHCWPTKRRTHALLQVEYCLDRVVAAINRAFHPAARRLGGCLGSLPWIAVLSWLKILRLEENPDPSRILNRSLIFFEEAKRRGLPIQALSFFGGPIKHFRFFWHGRWHSFEGIPLTVFPPGPELDDKDAVKNKLQERGFPIAQGERFFNPKKGRAFGLKLGWPLVVKPNAGSLSHHVTCDIRSKEELISAIRLAKQYQPVFVVERFVPGDLYRATVMGQNRVFVCRKERANVVGDGQTKIRELVAEKNRDAKRGATHQKNTTLHQIPLDRILMANLARHGLTLDSIPDAGQKITLQDKFTLALGCDIVACTQDAHPDNVAMFQNAARLLRAELVGFDFICQDIRLSYRDQPCAILEANSLPFLDMHACPSHGEADPVATAVWDAVLAKL